MPIYIIIYMDCLIRVSISENDKDRKFPNKMLRYPRRSHKNEHWHNHCQKVIKEQNLKGLNYSDISVIAKKTYQPLPKKDKPKKIYKDAPDKRKAWNEYFNKHKDDNIYTKMRYAEKYYQLKKVFNNTYKPKNMDPDELMGYSPQTDSESSSEYIDSAENPTLLRFEK